MTRPAAKTARARALGGRKMAACTPTVDGDTFKAQCWHAFCVDTASACSFCKCAACSQCASLPKAPPPPLPVRLAGPPPPSPLPPSPTGPRSLPHHSRPPHVRSAEARGARQSSMHHLQRPSAQSPPRQGGCVVCGAPLWPGLGFPCNETRRPDMCDSCCAASVSSTPPDVPAPEDAAAQQGAEGRGESNRERDATAGQGCKRPRLHRRPATAPAEAAYVAKKLCA